MAGKSITDKAAVLFHILHSKIRKGHYDLWTSAGEKREFSEGWDNTHPRPQAKRQLYKLLTKNWTLDGREIRMPYPPQSMMAEYCGEVGDVLHYNCTFEIPIFFTKKRILLHFGAVDQVAEVRVNGAFVGSHEGGYMPFTFDITDYVNRTAVNTLAVTVTDTLSQHYPYGKQAKNPGGMWYTPVSGIWQTVWLENVPEVYIKTFKTDADLHGIKIDLTMSGGCTDGFRVEVELPDKNIVKHAFPTMSGRIDIDDPQLWSPQHPQLYPMKIFAGEDMLQSYFALRTVNIQDFEGVQRVCHNEKPVFWHGILHQGYYSDGLYTPAEPEEYERDILRAKEMGFNMLRIHGKAEPDIFYYYCDKHGMLVMQDMVNSGKYSFIRDTALPTAGLKKRNDRNGFAGKQKEFFVKHLKETIDRFYNAPCVAAYTIFNEGWGQFESDRLYDLAKSLDPSRLVDSTSGWFHQKRNDFDSEHVYFKAIKMHPEKRPLLISECGGFSFRVEGHSYDKYGNYGYGRADSQEALTHMITDMYHQMVLPSIKSGICGCVYTQLSDAESETNGLLTYDRKVCKVDTVAMKQLSRQLYRELE